MNKQQTKGFTLIELMITVAIMAIILMVGVPSFTSSISKNSISSSINDIQSSLTKARSEAVTRGITVTLCSSDDQESCSGTWSDGWIIFSDENNDGLVTNSVDTLISVFDGLTGNNTLRLVATDTSMMQYWSSGYADQTGVFIGCPSDDDVDYSRAVIVSSSGMIRGSRDSDANNVHEDNNGTDLTCP